MKIPTRHELIQIFAQIDPRSPFGLRDRALIVLAANTGLRVAELVALHVRHVKYRLVDDLRDVLDVPRDGAKGSHQRAVPLNAAAKKAIAQILRFNAMRGFSVAPDAPLFQDRRHVRLPVRSVQRMLQKYRELADVADTITPHKVRHFWASRLVENGANLRSVQEMLGHRRLTTTQRYLHVAPEALANAVECLGVCATDHG